MTVLGFDQSTTCTGWCVFEDGNYVGSGLIDAKNSRKDATKRTNHMADNICASIDKVQPDLVVIEDIFDKNNIATVVMLARLQGMIMRHCNERGIPINIFAPSTWRSIVGIKKRKRAEAKAEAIKLVTDVYGLQVSEDEAEAVCIAHAAMIQFNK